MLVDFLQICYKYFKQKNCLHALIHRSLLNNKKDALTIGMVAFYNILKLTILCEKCNFSKKPVVISPKFNI
jgi:hypothetical protein